MKCIYIEEWRRSTPFDKVKETYSMMNLQQTRAFIRKKNENPNRETNFTYRVTYE